MRAKPIQSFLRGMAAAILLASSAAQAAAEETTVIPKRVIYPGETIDAGMLEEVRLVRGNRILTAIALYPDQVEGKVAKRTLLPGKLISLSSVREAWLVEAGAPVQVSFVEGGLQISTMGVPLQPGAAGDLIKIRNADSGAVFSGIVMGNGTVRVAYR